MGTGPLPPPDPLQPVSTVIVYADMRSNNLLTSFIVVVFFGLGGGAGRIILTGATKWESVWDAVFQMLRPSSRLGRADMSRGAELLQSLLITGAVDADRVLARFDPLRILGKDQNLAAWQALMITIACTAPKHLSGSVDRIFDRLMLPARITKLGSL